MVTQSNIIADLSSATKVPNKALTELISKEILCIGSAVHDALINKDEAIVLNIGLGTLSISLTDMQCKFIPGKELKAIIKRSITDKIDPLELVLEQTLIEKLMKICDEN